MKRRKLSGPRLGVRRQLAFGVMHEIQAASFGNAPRPRSHWPTLVSLGGWLLVAAIAAGFIALSCAH